MIIIIRQNTVHNTVQSPPQSELSRQGKKDQNQSQDVAIAVKTQYNPLQCNALRALQCRAVSCSVVQSQCFKILYLLVTVGLLDWWW